MPPASFLPMPPARPATHSTPGSPEEQYLRRHSHYLSPDSKVAVRALLELLTGLLANLASLLVWLFVAASALGWIAHAGGVLPRLGSNDTRLGGHWWWWAIPPSLAGLGLLVSIVQRATRPYIAPSRRWIDGTNAWTSRLISGGAFAALLLLGVPAATSGLAQLALNDQPNAAVARVITSAGFATTVGLQAKRGTRRECVRTLSRDPEHPGPEPADIGRRWHQRGHRGEPAGSAGRDHRRRRPLRPQAGGGSRRRPRQAGARQVSPKAPSVDGHHAGRRALGRSGPAMVPRRCHRRFRRTRGHARRGGPRHLCRPEDLRRHQQDEPPRVLPHDSRPSSPCDASRRIR